MKIINFGQVVDLENGTVDLGYQLTVLMPSGQRISVSTNEETVRQLTEIVIGATIPAEEMELVEEQPAAAIFGPGPDNGENVMGQIAEEEYEEQVMRGMVGGLGSPPTAQKPAKPRARQPLIDEDGFMRPPPAKTVQQDEMGYPVVSASRNMPTQEDLIEDEEDPGESV